MEWYLVCTAAVVLTLFSKGFTGFRVERMRTNLAHIKREAQEAKSHLAEARKRQADLQRSIRAKEIRATKLKQGISMMEQRARG